MENKQKTVAIGLRNIAQRVENNDYGKGDNAFDDNDDDGGSAQAFLNDLHDEVIEKL